MNILIAGYGFVGKAHEALLKDKHNILIHDPALGYEANFNNADAVIVCVATPPHESGSCNINNVYDVINETPHDVPILIKSTISLEGWRYLKESFENYSLAFSPEFLRAESAIDDLRNAEVLLIGGDCVDVWRKTFENFIQEAEPEELILAKYFRNSFLATKVAFFNQMYDLCEKTGVDYDFVSHFTAMDKRIGTSHTYVTEERGFGGHCFPKDTAAIVSTAEKNDCELSIIKEAIEYNKKIRK